MKRFVKTTRGLAAGFALFALFAMTAQQATAQFVAVNNYQAPPTAAVPAYGTPPTAAYEAQPAANYAAPPTATYGAQPTANYATPPTAAYGAQPTMAHAVPPVATYAVPPNYNYPRVAQTATLPAPAEAIKAVVPVTPQQAAPAAQPAYATPATNYSQPATMSPAAATMPSAYSQAPMGQSTHQGTPSAGCATGNCGGTNYAAPASVGYGYQAGGCATGGCDTGGCYGAAPACDVGCAAPAPRRQWFAGLYGMYLSRANDQSKRMVAYMTDTAGWAPPTPDYYPTTADPTLFTDAAGEDDLFGAEFRFGSTFGCDPCGCSQPFAWEIGYWALDDDSSSATLIYPGTVEIGNTQRLYQNTSYGPLNVDLDNAGTTWTDRPFYGDDGMPASRDLDANDVRIIGMRVRQRFQAQNLELNFWRFGTPAASCGAGACGTSACGVGSSCDTGSCGTGACGVSSCGVGSCGPTSCAPCAAPCRPPRRFFINGLVGMRYLRVDDDFGLDQQFTLVDTDPTSGTYGDPPAGWPTAYEGFPIDDNSVIFSDYEADNELIGFQLGCSMNWLVGCRWNIFADTNMGIYGNNAEVYKRVYGGGDSYVTFANGGGAAAVRGSETNVSFVGELRAGVGYQVTCNCRLTAAYRFIGIGGVALGAEEYQNTVWTNAETASHIDTNNSIILHGLQTGVECKF